MAIGVRVTLKALANFSPGFALKPWVRLRSSLLVPTLKGLRGSAVVDHTQLLQICHLREINPGLSVSLWWMPVVNPPQKRTQRLHRENQNGFPTGSEGMRVPWGWKS
jgi:hypothetical protein